MYDDRVRSSYKYEHRVAAMKGVRFGTAISIFFRQMFFLTDATVTA